MKRTISISAAIALAVFSYTPSLAKCHDVTGSVNKDSQTGIAKDGTHVPLEGNSGSQAKTETPTGTTTTSADALPKTPQKDGGNMPMGESSNLATSGQDVASQQKGNKTAAAQDKCD
ncbi:hypothetical protein J2046_004186 [Rhizobium petrolearium]|uniref:hypothetical protein n=1 Tax=Neorhizobium petrolearium TaxID=515361 RepID=UPI001AE45C01|nr:hypothetical protein [Neorhizobium petrolearium]MBP1845912.1 hypothetical protein [Neorhizobium petrolearium]